MRIDKRKILNGSHMVKLTLTLSALVAVGIAGTILFAPEAFYAGYGIEVGGDATLVNELKAPAGVLLVAGLLMFAGVFRTELLKVSLTTASVVYLSYGLSRLLSMAIDGLPHSSLVSAAGIELGIGAACLLALLRARDIYPHYVPTRRTQ
jgi:hypothetical protein